MPSSAGHAARNLPPRDQFHIDGLDDEEEAGEEPHVSYDQPWSTQPPAGSHHPEPSQHAVVDSHDGHHSDNVDLLANLRHNEGRFDPMFLRPLVQQKHMLSLCAPIGHGANVGVYSSAANRIPL